VKKLINGKLFNTDTATFIGDGCSKCGMSDFNWFSEKLFKTKKGQFFLVGEGGPMSKWAQSCGTNSWGSGSGMKLLTREQALEWAETYLDVDEVLEEFAIEEG
jgi:hypothetical protein